MLFELQVFWKIHLRLTFNKGFNYLWDYSFLKQTDTQWSEMQRKKIIGCQFWDLQVGKVGPDFSPP